MARAFNRVVTVVVTSFFDLPFGTQPTYPQWANLTAAGVLALERPFTAGNDPGPNGLIQAEGYNYTRDSVTLDLVVAESTMFTNAFSPITT
jgi:hypothetical protein